jgi:hypothetical protein
MRPHDCLYGSMAPSPCLPTVKTPLVSKLVFYQPACSAAPLNAEALANLEATSQDIAFTISESHQIPDGWGVVHLARHMDLLTGRLCAINTLSRKLDHEKARQRGGIATFRNRQFCHHSWDQYADRFGQILDKLQDKPGYSASWLLSKLTVLAAAPLPPTLKDGGEFRRFDGTLDCYHRGGNAIAELGSSFNASSVLSLSPTPNHGGDSQRVNGTLACYHRGGNAIPKLGLSFIANSVFSHPPSTNDGGERRLGSMPCFGTQSPAFGIHHV